jgi:hypothetical protein
MEIYDIASRKNGARSGSWEAGLRTTLAARLLVSQIPHNKELKMETIILGLLIFSFIIIISIDTAQKCRNFLDKGQ